MAMGKEKQNILTLKAKGLVRTLVNIHTENTLFASSSMELYSIVCSGSMCDLAGWEETASRRRLCEGSYWKEFITF